MVRQTSSKQSKPRKRRTAAQARKHTQRQRRRRLALWIGTGVLATAIAAYFFVPNNGTLRAELPPARFVPLYIRAAEAYHVPWQFLAAIHHNETNYNRSLSMISSAGAVGPMQFMPTTWKEYGVNVLFPGTPASPMNLADAVFASAHMFHALGMHASGASLSRYWIARYAGSYDAGPGNWDNGSAETTAYRAHAVALFALIRRDVVVPPEDIQYWNSLSLSDVLAIANGQAPLYPLSSRPITYRDSP